MKIINNIEQGSPEWFDIRRGIQTASNFSAVLAGGSGATRKAYMYKLASEILTGVPEESFTNSYMEWGTKTEPQARSMYEMENVVRVFQVGFIIHDSIRAGCSPDGLVGDNGLVEFKCPKTSTQIETYLSGKMPTTHTNQVQGQLWISEREWCDFVSFDPRINAVSGYFCERIYRDEKKIIEIKEGVEKFQNDLDDLISKLR